MKIYNSLVDINHFYKRDSKENEGKTAEVKKMLNVAVDVRGPRSGGRNRRIKASAIAN
jgi:hypothetical protein